MPLLLYSGSVTLVYKETLTCRHIPLPNSRVSSPCDNKCVLHCYTVYIAAVTPANMVGNECQYSIECCPYFSTPRHSVSSVLVAHILAVASSLPVTNMDPSSDKHMQLMLSSWSAMVSSNSPFFPPVDPPAPILTSDYQTEPGTVSSVLSWGATTVQHYSQLMTDQWAMIGWLSRVGRVKGPYNHSLSSFGCGNTHNCWHGRINI